MTAGDYIDGRCDGGTACPNFAGHYPIGDHGWYHRLRAGCITAPVAPARPAAPLQLTLL